MLKDKVVPYTQTSYTTLTPSPCAEHLKQPIGKTCFSEKFLKMLRDNIKNLKPASLKQESFLDEEIIPNDGSKDSNLVRDVMRYLQEDSEYSLLLNKKIIDLVGDDIIASEKNRFKPYGNKFLVGPTCGEEINKILDSWTRVFKFFKYVDSEIYSSIEKINMFTAKDIVEQLNDKIKVVAGVSNYATLEDSGWHALAILVDSRYESTTIEFFDSMGDPPPYRFTELMYNIQQLIPGSKITISSGNLVHQDTDSECAMHCLIYIRRRLEGVSSQVFRTNKIFNGLAEKFRYFIYAS